MDGDNGGAFYSLVPNLEFYNVNGMKFNGPIYSEIGTLTNLDYMSFGHLEAYGTIPTELGLLTDLLYADLSSLPSLEGSLPSELGLLSKLTWLDLSGTPITGTVPPALCKHFESGLLDMQANWSLIECSQQED